MAESHPAAVHSTGRGDIAQMSDIQLLPDGFGSPSSALEENDPLLDEADNMSTDESDHGDASQRVLRKIDRTIIPLLFVTYMFNFMDKSILSSAAVFGLREDNVRRPIPIPRSIAHPL